MKLKENRNFYQSGSVLIFLGVLLFSGNFLQSQIIGQDADAYSTIVLPSSSLNLDIVNNIATFNYFTYLKEQGTIPPFGNDRLIVGGELKGTSKNGVSPFFSKEKIVSEASLRFLIGSKKYKKVTKGNSKLLIKIIEEEVQVLESLEVIQSGYGKYFTELKNKPNLDSIFLKKLEMLSDYNSDVEDWQKLEVLLNEERLKLQKYPNIIKLYENLINRINSIISLGTSETDKKIEIEVLKHYVDNTIIADEYINPKLICSISSTADSVGNDDEWIEIKNKIDRAKDNLLKNRKEMETIIKKLLDEFVNDTHLTTLKKYAELHKTINDLSKNSTYTNSNLWYIRGGFNGFEFKYDKKDSIDLIENRIIDKNFNGWDAEIGYTRQFKLNNLIGVSLRASYTNNFSGGLIETEYALTKVDTTITEGSFSTTDKIKAYSGDYETFMQYSINLDYVRVIATMKGGEESDLFLTLNPYLRHQIYDGSMKLKNNTVLGIGFNAFNSEEQKIMGGLFVQTNDLFGVHDKEDSNLGNRIVFGLVAKFSFSGIELKE